MTTADANAILRKRRRFGCFFATRSSRSRPGRGGDDSLMALFLQERAAHDKRAAACWLVTPNSAMTCSLYHEFDRAAGGWNRRHLGAYFAAVTIRDQSVICTRAIRV